MRCTPKVLDTEHKPICFHFLTVFKLEFLSLLSTLAVFLPVSFLRRPVFPRPLLFWFFLSCHPFSLSVRRRAAVNWHQQFVGPLCLRPGRGGRREECKATAHRASQLKTS